MAGDDAIFGGNGQNLLFGDAAADVLLGGQQRDIMTGGDGDDILLGYAAADQLTDTAGNDALGRWQRRRYRERGRGGRRPVWRQRRGHPMVATARESSCSLRAIPAPTTSWISSPGP